MTGKDLFDASTYQEIVDRINTLTPSTVPEWGKMNVAQMLAHCAEVIDVGNGKPLKGTPWYLKPFGGIVKKMVLSEKPYPKDLGTHPQYVMGEPEDFNAQKERLLLSMKAMIALGRVAKKHPLMGHMSAEERGFAQYKHLDHHLTQFGV